jgi:hypothetical protein
VRRAPAGLAGTVVEVRPEDPDPVNLQSHPDLVIIADVAVSALWFSHLVVDGAERRAKNGPKGFGTRGVLMKATSIGGYMVRSVLVKRVLPALATVPLVSLVAVSGASAAEEGYNLNARLHGPYAFTQTQNCFRTDSKFDGQTGLLDPLPAPPNSPVAYVNPNRGNSAVSGVVLFNGDGTGSETFRQQVTLASIPPPIPFAEVEGSCSLTYSVTSDGSGTIQFTLCTSTNIAGGGSHSPTGPGTSTYTGD